MFRFRVLLNIANLLMFSVLFSGCAGDRLIRTKEELAGREASPLRSELDIRVVFQNRLGFSLAAQIKNIAVVRDSLKIEEFYERGVRAEGNVMGLLGVVIGVGGCLGGYKYAESSNCLYDDKFMHGCLMSCASVILGGIIISKAGSSGGEFVEVLPGYVKRDTVCVDSLFLIKQKIKVMVENSDFEKYYTDENGNIELKFSEIFPKPADSDSILELIVRYYELVDTVEVRRL
jgi:hypothetical protein